MSETEAQDQAYNHEYQGYQEYAEYQEYQEHDDVDPSAKAAGTWIQCFDEETGYPYLYNDVTGETKWVDAETSNDLVVTLWQKFYDDNGDEFYYNPVTFNCCTLTPNSDQLKRMYTYSCYVILAYRRIIVGTSSRCGSRRKQRCGERRSPICRSRI